MSDTIDIPPGELESTAFRMIGDLGAPALATGMAATFSCAISAKRSADALERIAETLERLTSEVADPKWGIAPALRNLSR